MHSTFEQSTVKIKTLLSHNISNERSEIKEIKFCYHYVLHNIVFLMQLSYFYRLTIGSRCLKSHAIDATDDETRNGIGTITSIRTHDETRAPSHNGSTTRYVLLILNKQTNKNKKRKIRQTSIRF